MQRPKLAKLPSQTRKQQGPDSLTAIVLIPGCFPYELEESLPTMNTISDDFYEDTRFQLGHLAAELAQLLDSMDEKKFHHSIVESLKSQVFHHKDLIIDKLRTAEESIRDVRGMIDQ